MKTPSIFLLLTIFAFSLSSCEKVEKGIDTSVMPVIEAYLIPGQPLNMKITKTVDNTSGSISGAEPIDGLEVKISCGEESFILISDGDGNYSSSEMQTIKAGFTYSMEFEYDGNIVSSTTIVPTNVKNFTLSAKTLSVPSFNRDNFDPGQGFPSFPDPLKVKWDNDDNKYYLVVVKCIESDPELINSDEDAPERPIFRNNPQNSINEYDINFMSFKYFGYHQIILTKLNAEYAELYNNTGTSSQNITAPYTNVINGLGIFTAINADTLILKVTD